MICYAFADADGGIMKMKKGKFKWFTFWMNNNTSSMFLIPNMSYFW